MRIPRKLTPLLLGALVLATACDDDDDPAGPATEFSATLTGAAEVEPVTTNATGTATFELDGDELDFTLTTTGLSNVTAAHIHGPAAAGVNAGVIVPLFFAEAEGAWDGSKSATLTADAFVADQSVTTMAALIALMRTGQAYVNVHTTANPAGAIRGQIAGN